MADATRLGEALRRFRSGAATDEGRLAMALDHAARLNEDPRPATQLRPGSLPTDDELITLHERQERGERLGASEDKLMTPTTSGRWWSASAG